MDKAAALIFAASTVVCGAGWFLTRLSRTIILYCWKERGYTLPKKTELKACSLEVVSEMFTFGRKAKH